MMKKPSPSLCAAACAAFLALLSSPQFARAAGPPRIFEDPTVSSTRIAFRYGGDIWIVGRNGGQAQRIVTGVDLVAGPYFSPDGSKIAYSGTLDGNTDVYVVSAYGGEPRRLTYHPDPDVVVGWTPDGKSILFASRRASHSDSDNLFTIPVNGGFPAELPLGMAEDGSYSPDATHIAYVPSFQWEPQWQHYRGGQTSPIWIANLADSGVVKIPRENENDRSPMWVGDTIYFLSDRNGPYTLFSYDTRTRAIRQLIANHGLDMLSASAGPGAIVYTQLGSLHLYDTATHAAREVPVTIAGDLPQTQPHWINVGNQIQNANVSPSGVRAVFEAHGDILTVPADHGDIRNLTATPGIEERDPAWSPDGRWIAYFSDAGGEYSLDIKDQKGLQPARVIHLGPNPSFFYTPTWSPDSKKIAYSDKHLHLWYVDLDEKDPKPVLVDTGLFETFGVGAFNEQWSPDSRWLTYNKQLPNYLGAVFVYNLADRRSTQITDGMSNANDPAFDRSGKYLYFLASTDTALTSAGLDMTSDQHPVSSSLYAVVLDSKTASPMAPQTGDEPVTGDEPAPSSTEAPKKQEKSAASKDVTIDFAGISQRIIALPVPAANYQSVSTGSPGEVYLLQAPLASVGPGFAGMSVVKFSVAARRAMPIDGGVSAFALSFNGKKMLVQKGDRWFVEETDGPVKSPGPPLATDAMEVYSVPHEEWTQMYRETWRIERDFFYDKHFGGLNIAQAEQRFSVFLPGLASRDDFTFLTHQMLSYLATGHMWVSGGPPQPNETRVDVGLLGADYTIEHDRYRFATIYSGLNWTPQLHAPLTQPGEEVKTGDYLLAVNGRPLTARENIYHAFEETAGKQTILTVGPNPDGSGSHDVTVTPVANEFALRNYGWIQHNIDEVNRLSGGKLGYVYLPDTGYGGFTNFNRYFFSQVDKQGIILDERYNHGGQVADYIIDALSRKPMSMLVPRDGKITLDPPLAVYGPKVMIINQFAGSGGDAMPWYFRMAHIGPLVGVRTWGGLVGIGGYPSLMDGGSVMAPRIAIGGLNGHWVVEGHGIPPDIEVWQDPKLIREGHDPQLETAVQTALRMLREHPLPKYVHPPYPEHHLVIPQMP